MSAEIKRQEEVNRRMAQICEPGSYLVIAGTHWATVRVHDLTDGLRSKIAAKLDDIPHRITDRTTPDEG